MMFHIHFNIISAALSHSQLYAILDPQGIDQPLSTVANTMGDNLSIFPYQFSGQLPKSQKLLLCLCLTSHQQLRSYGDKATA